MKNLWIFVLLCGCFYTPALFAENSSIYSTVDEKKCKQIDMLITDRILESAKGENVFFCGGVNGFYLFLIDDGTRSWYALQKDGCITSFEEEIIYKNSIGNFPNVGVNDKVEWRVDKDGKVIGLIFRVFYQTMLKSGKHQSTSRLFVVDLRDMPKVIGIVKKNLSAHRLIDDK